MRFKAFLSNFLLVAVSLPLSTQSEVIITDKTERETLAVIKSVPASFGKPLPEDGIHGHAVMAIPKDGCSQLEPPPNLTSFYFSSFNDSSRALHPLPLSMYPVISGDEAPSKSVWIAMIARYGGCTFEDKVRNAQRASYSAVIVYNKDSDKVIPMGGDDSTLIPSVFIGASDADLMSKLFVYSKNPSVHIILTDDEPFDINSYLLPFAIVVGICFLIMLGIVIFKCVQDYRRNRRHRLPKSALKKLPIHKFKTGDPFETCCICLDDFEDGEKLRVLPCDHGYHAKCIDPWLLKNKRICPQCRKKVFASNERGARLISGSGGSDSDDETTNERAPLLRPQPQRGNGAYGGTSSTNVDMSPSEAASTSRGDTSASMSRLPGRRRRPFFARVVDRNRTRVATPFDNNAGGTDTLSSSEESTSSSDDDDVEGNVTSHLHTGDVVVTHRNETDRHVASAEIHVPPPVQEEEQAKSESDVCDGGLEVVVVVAHQPSQERTASPSENSTSQNHTGADVETV